MTSTIETAAPTIERPRRSYVARGIAAVLLLIGGVTTVATVRHLDNQYGPVQSGSFWGPRSDAA